MPAERPIFLKDDSTALADAAPCALVIGNFDGVHRGHQSVLEQAVAYSRSAKAALSPRALTFDPHPAQVVGLGQPPLLTSLDDRVQLMARLGIERVYVRQFDKAFAAWPPERFATQLVARELKAKVVFAGQNLRFGTMRSGDLALLRELGGRLGFEVLVHEVAGDGRGPYSSTRARDAVAAGDLDEACRVLGRPHALTGSVVRGDARGRTLGFPTANVEGIVEIVPPNGVYAVKVEGRAGDGGYQPLARGVTNIGVRPTIGGQDRTVETHLLDFDDDLYGRRLKLSLVVRLRAEQKFASLEDLKAQIAKDVARARAVVP
jgi:riboflavin kinase/FMN adenylyltransferase